MLAACREDVPTGCSGCQRGVQGVLGACLGETRVGVDARRRGGAAAVCQGRQCCQESSHLPGAELSSSSRCLPLLPAACSERFTTIILCVLPALTGAVNHPLAKTHWGWWDRDGTGCVWDAAPLGRVREAGHPNLEVGSASRPRVPRDEPMPQRWAKARRGPGAWRGLGRLRKRKPSPASTPEASRPRGRNDWPERNFAGSTGG